MSTDKNGKKRQVASDLPLGMYYTAWLTLAVTDIFCLYGENGSNSEQRSHCVHACKRFFVSRWTTSLPVGVA